MISLWNYNPKYIIPIQVFFLYCWLVNLIPTDAYYSVYLLVALAACFAFHHNYLKKPKISNKTFLGVCMMSGGFALAMVLSNYNIFIPWTATKSLVEAACTLLGGWIAFVHILIFLVTQLPFSVAFIERSHPYVVFFGVFGILAVIYLSHLFFYSYPGVVTNDAVTTIKQILTGEYDNIMPFWHTLTVELFFRLGMALFGEINRAIAFYHVVQCLFLAACFAYAILTLYQIGIPHILLGVVLAGYGILPYHIAYSATMWKDVLFGAAALLMVTALLRIIKNVGQKKIWNTVVFIIGSVGLALWRTNGLFAFGSLFLVMVLFLRKKYKRLLTIMSIIFVVCWVLTSPLLTALNIPDTDFVEALAIPFQQVSRVIASDLPLTDADNQMLSEVFDMDLVRAKYNPNIVDPIKFASMRSKIPLMEDPLAYISLWLKLGLKYPGTYLEAWVEETKGYWNAGYDYWIYTYVMGENDFGIMGSDGENIIGSTFWKVVSYPEKFKVFQPFYSIGLHVWLTVICCFVNVQKRRDISLLSLPGIVIIAGLLIGTPVFAEFRYAYPIFTTLPIIVCTTVFEQKNQEE